MSLSTARPQCERSRKSTRVWSAFTLDLIGMPLIVLRPLKSRSKSFPSLLPPSLMIWLTVMPRFSQACSCSHGHVGDELGDVVDAQRFADLVDGQAHVGRRERRIPSIDARGLQLDRISCAVQVEPCAGGGGVLVILDAEEGNGLRAA